MMTRSLYFLLLALPTVTPVSAAPPESRARLPQLVTDTLDWLPTDTETLIVANNFTIAPRNTDQPMPFSKSLEALSTGLFRELHDGVLLTRLAGQKVRLAVEGSRKFRSPKSLGLMPFEGCQILRFDKTARGAVEKSMAACIEQAAKTQQVGKHTVAVFKELWEQDEWVLLVAHPQPDVLLCATDRGYLEEVLARMHTPQRARAFPDALPEWQHVDLSAKSWAIRHYRQEDAQTDPSSPLGPEAAANQPDPHARGFVFWFDAAKNTAYARYLSGSKTPVKIVTAGWHYPAEKLTPRIERVKPGIVEVSADVSAETHSSIFLFVLMGYLGHGVYL